MPKNKKSQKKTGEKNESKPEVPVQPPSNFITIVRDFLKDLSVTFPEYIYLWASWTDPKLPDSEIQRLYDYCITVFPERFFDILYQSEDLFKVDNTANTFFYQTLISKYYTILKMCLKIRKRPYGNIYNYCCLQ